MVDPFGDKTAVTVTSGFWADGIKFLAVIVFHGAVRKPRSVPKSIS